MQTSLKNTRPSFPFWRGLVSVTHNAVSPAAAGVGGPSLHPDHHHQHNESLVILTQPRRRRRISCRSMVSLIADC